MVRNCEYSVEGYGLEGLAPSLFSAVVFFGSKTFPPPAAFSFHSTFLASLLGLLPSVYQVFKACMSLQGDRRKGAERSQVLAQTKKAGPFKEYLITLRAQKQPRRERKRKV